MKSEEAADNITVVSCPLIGRMIAGYEPGRYHFLTKLRWGVDYSRTRRKASYVLYPHFTRYFDVFLCFPGVDFVSSITTNGCYMLHSRRVGGFEWQDSIALISLCILAFDGTPGIQYAQESIRRSRDNAARLLCFLKLKFKGIHVSKIIITWSL